LEFKINSKELSLGAQRKMPMMSTKKTQNRLPAILIAIAFIYLLTSCKGSTTDPLTPTDKLPLLSPTNYHHIVLQLVDYDVVQITHKAGLDLRSKNIHQIEIGKKKDTIFHQIATFPLFYDTNANTYLIRFELTIALDQTVIWFPLTIRYRSNDHTYTDIDTMIELYKYPYSSAEVFTDSELIYPNLYQDIARTESKFFFHGWNSDGLNEYDLVTHQKTIYMFYFGGSHITANSKYVFCDINHKQVVRFNLATKIPDLTLPEIQNINLIMGIAIDNSSLLVLVNAGLTYGEAYLQRFTLDGILVDSMPYPESDSYFMAIADSVVYCKLYLDDPQISRFNLRTRSFLSNVLSPARYIGGMEIYKDTLYFCDRWKNMVGTVAVADLLPVN
jgi:hypothetical protein